MKIEIESRHSDWGPDAGGYSVLRIDGVWIGRIEDKKGREKVEELISKVGSVSALFCHKKIEIEGTKGIGVTYCMRLINHEGECSSEKDKTNVISDKSGK